MTAQHKILVIGGFCSGKTTWSELLAEKLQIKALHLDDHFWYGDWQNIGKAQLLVFVQEKIQKEAEWIIEGNYSIIRDNIWEHCTCIYYCYASPLAILKRIIQRSYDPARKGVPVQVRTMTQNKEPLFELLYKAMQYYFVKRKKDLTFCKHAQRNGIEVRLLKCTSKNMLVEIRQY